MIASSGEILMDLVMRTRMSRSRDDKGMSIQLAAFLLGLALFIVGYIGIFFGRLIKSAVSRQREFLADASAVQFAQPRWDWWCTQENWRADESESMWFAHQ